ncbi:MAG: chitobiase/beta-hexosaminidase C-terminal domain-containing protein [Bacteroidales bacterium]|nr:chitobiase/beta-hexosaminidase C-terminal domain-containing protein [Bacteroidales bacterium]
MQKLLQHFNSGRFSRLAFSLCLVMLMSVSGVWGQTDEVYSTCLFGSNYNNSSTQNYTSTWTATNNGFSWTIVNGNNNQNGWSYVKFGRKNNASVGSITTVSAYTEAITKIDLTIDALTTSKINSITLYTSPDSSSWTSADTFTKSAGTQSVTLSTPTANLYYKIEFDCASGSSNGLITISKVEYYHASSSTQTVATPTISPNGGEFLNSQEVTLTCSTSGATIHYTTDGDEPTSSSTSYTVPFTINATTTVKAIAYSGTEASDVATAEFTKVQPYANIAALTALTESGNYYVTLDNAVVTYVNGKYAYIQDASGAVVMYKNEHGLTAGQTISGTASVTYAPHNSNPQITNLEGVTPTSGTAPDPTTVSASDWSYTFNNVLSQYFQITGATITQSSNKYYVSLGGEDIQLYKVGSALSNIDLSRTYTIVGFPTLYNTTQELQIFEAPVVEATSDPVVSVSPYTITNLSYVVDNGPSAAQSISVSGENLSDNITVALDANSNFEISLSESDSYTSSLTLTQTEGTVEATTIYVRLKFGLQTADYSGTITVSSTGATSSTVNLSGSVTAPEPANVTWNLSIDETATATENEMTWTSNFATMGVAKGEASTNTNNYYPGTSGHSYTSTRFYAYSNLTIAPVSGYIITSVVFQATTENYATVLKNSTWNNAAATASSTTVTVTPTDGTSAITATIGGTCGFTSVTVYYEANTTPSITVAAPTENVPYAGADGTLNVTYQNISDVVADIEFFESDGITSATYTWIDAEINTENNVNYVVGPNTANEARTAYFKVYALDGDDYVYSDLVTITQSAAPQQYTLTVSELSNVDLSVYTGGQTDAIITGEGSAQLTNGTAIEIQVSALSGYSLQTLMVDGEDVTSQINTSGIYEFTMPEHAVAITATATEIVPGEWVLVTDPSTLSAGDQVVIAAAEYNYAMSTTQNSNNRGQVAITKVGNTLTINDNVQIFTVGKVENNFTFYTGSGYIYAASSSSNHLKTETTLDANGQWAVTITDGAASIVAQGDNNRNNLRYNPSSSIFSCYASGQEPVALYKFGATAYTVTLNAGSGTCDETTMTGSNVTLPTCSTTCDGYNFVGWSETAVEAGTTETPLNIYAAGSQYAPEADVTLYAVYMSGEETWAAATEIAAGDVVYLVSEDNSKELSYIELYDGVPAAYETHPAGLYPLWVVDGSTSGTFAFKNADNQYLECDIDDSYLDLNTTVTATTSWTVSFNTDGDATITNASITNRIILFNPTQDGHFKPYKTTTQGTSPVQLYKHYTTGEYTTTPCVGNYTVYFFEGTGDCGTVSLKGSSITLPEATTTCEDWEFEGWTTTPVNETTTAPTILASPYTPAQDSMFLYAIYTDGTNYNSFPTCVYTQLGVAEGFEIYTTATPDNGRTTVKPTGWTVVTQENPVAKSLKGRPEVFYCAPYAHEGDYSLFIDSLTLLAMPKVADGIVISNMVLEMYVRQPYDFQSLEVGVMTDLTNPNSFVLVGTINNVGGAVNYRVVDFSNYTGEGRYIAFRNKSSQESEEAGMRKSFNYIDDVTLKVNESLCGITTLPYENNFDATTAESELACWTVAQKYYNFASTYAPQIFTLSAYANSGENTLLLDGRCIYAMPELKVTDVDVSDLQMEFYARQPYSGSSLEVGVMSDLNDANSFVTVATFSYNGNSGQQRHVVNFSEYTGAGRYIAFRNLYDGTWGRSPQYIDDIVLAVPGSGDCGIASLPYENNFDQTTAADELSCWTVSEKYYNFSSEYAPQIYALSSFAQSGENTLLLDGRCLYAMPELTAVDENEELVSVANLQMELYVRQPYAASSLEVGVMTDVNDPSTFVVVKTIGNNGYTGQRYHVVDFSGYTGTGRYIAFRNAYDGTWGRSPQYIDNIVLDVPVADDCGITSLPYVNSFDDAAAEEGLSCWTVAQKYYNFGSEYAPQIFEESYFAHSGSYTLMLDGRCLYSMPELKVEGVEVSDLQMEFYVRQPYAASSLEVGVMTDVNDPSTFVVVETISHNGATNQQQHTVDFSGYTGEGTFIAFRNLYDGTWGRSTMYIDDINLSQITTSPDAVAEDPQTEEETAEEYVDETANEDIEEVMSPLGVEDYDITTMTVYPNPTTGKITISADVVNRVEVYSQIGVLVAVYTEERVIDLSNMPSGVYVLRVTMPQGVAVRKVVKK